MEDVTTVLDACGSDRVVIEAQAEAAMLAVVFAATHPERVSHLILMHPMARTFAAPGYEWGWADEETRDREFIRPILARWGTGENGAVPAPVMADDPEFIEWWGRWERLSSSPGTMEKRMKLLARDRRTRDPAAGPDADAGTRPAARAGDGLPARPYFAEHIPGRDLVELPGRDAISLLRRLRGLLEAVERFVTGAVATRRGERALATRHVHRHLRLDRGGGGPGRPPLAGAARASRPAHPRPRRRLRRRRASSRPATASWRPSTARRGRCAAPPSSASGSSDLGIQLRAGLHTGEVELIGADVGGMAVHIGARIGALGDPGEVLASSTVEDLVVGSGIEFADRGAHALKGVPGEWQLFAVDCEE